MQALGHQHCNAGRIPTISKRRSLSVVPAAVGCAKAEEGLISQLWE